LSICSALQELKVVGIATGAALQSGALVKPATRNMKVRRIAVQFAWRGFPF